MFVFQGPGGMGGKYGERRVGGKEDGKRLLQESK